MKKHLFSILTIYLFFFIFSFPLFSEPDSNKLETVLSSYFGITDTDTISRLMTEKRLDNLPAGINDFTFLPAISEKSDIEKEIRKQGFTSAIESIFIISDSSLKPDPVSRAFAVLTDLETMNGIKYYSASRKHDRVLFNEAYFVDNENSRTRINFTPQAVLEKNYSFTAFVHDNTFGRNYFYNNYSVSDNYILMKMGNISRLTYGIIPVLKKDSLIFYMIIIPAGDYLVLYCSGTSNTIDNDFIRNKINQSIYNRVTALSNWFSLNYQN